MRVMAFPEFQGLQKAPPQVRKPLPRPHLPGSSAGPWNARGPAMMRLSLTAGALVLLAGCASFSPDGGFDSVGQLAQERAGVTPVWQRTENQGETAQARTTELLGQPLTPDSAVELAILNNRGLQASFQELGIAESDLVRAGRLSNPSFSFARLSGGGHVEIERAVGFNILGLLTMPLAKRVEEQRFARVRLQAAADTVRVCRRHATGVLRGCRRSGVRQLLPAGQGSSRGLPRARKPHGSRRQLQQAGASARAGLLRRRDREPRKGAAPWLSAHGSS